MKLNYLKKEHEDSNSSNKLNSDYTDALKTSLRIMMIVKTTATTMLNDLRKIGLLS